MKLTQPSLKLVDAIQSLIAERSSVDVRVRCKDHQPSDGLGKDIFSSFEPCRLSFSSEEKAAKFKIAKKENLFF